MGGAGGEPRTALSEAAGSSVLAALRLREAEPEGVELVFSATSSCTVDSVRVKSSEPTAAPDGEVCCSLTRLFLPERAVRRSWLLPSPLRRVSARYASNIRWNCDEAP